MTERQRLLIIGLDGATWDVIDPLIAQGALPHIAALVAGGASCALRSTMPPITPPAWATMLTGVNPGKHGVFGFSQRIPGAYDYQGTTNRSRRAEALWNVISRRGGTSLLVSIPVTYPPDEVTGVMIAGMGTPDTSADFVYPPAEKDKLLTFCPDYLVDISGRVGNSDVIALCMQEISQRSSVTRWLMSRHDWDLCMTVFVAPDRVQHAFWQEGEVADDIAAVYAALDGAIGELLQAAGNGCPVLLVSDHGFGPASLALSASSWLQQRGLGSPHKFVSNLLGDALPGLIPDSALSASAGCLACADQDDPEHSVRLVTTAPDSVAKLTLPDLVVEPHSALRVKLHCHCSQPGMILEAIDHSIAAGEIIYTCMLAAGQQEIVFPYRPVSEHLQLSLGLTTFGGNPCGELRLSSIKIDFSQRLTGALAFAGNDAGSIHLNIRGRDVAGVVLPGIEETNVKHRLLQELSAWRAAGLPVVSAAYTRERFTGPYVHMAPDIVFWSDHLRPLQTQPGTHRFDGVFVAHGPGIAPGRLRPAQIADVMPTALYLLGQPIPQGLDGHVLTAVLAANYLSQHPVQAADDQTGLPAVAPATFTASEQAILEERLRDLGYIE